MDSWMARDEVQRRAQEIGGQFATTIAARNLASEMATRSAVQQAMSDRTKRSTAVMDCEQRELIRTELRIAQSSTNTDNNDDDQQHLLFRKTIAGNSRLRTNDWPSKPRGSHSSFCGKWAVFQMACGGHSTVHWVVQDETLMGLSCLTGVSVHDLLEINKNNHELTSLRRRGVNDDVFFITGLPSKTLIVVWSTPVGEDPKHPPIFDGRWSEIDMIDDDGGETDEEGVDDDGGETATAGVTAESNEPNPSPPHDFDDCPFQNGDKVMSRYRGTDGNRFSRSKYPGMIIHTCRSTRGFDFDIFFDDGYIEKVELVTRGSGVVNIIAV